MLLRQRPHAESTRAAGGQGYRISPMAALHHLDQLVQRSVPSFVESHCRMGIAASRVHMVDVCLVARATLGKSIELQFADEAKPRVRYRLRLEARTQQICPHQPMWGLHSEETSGAFRQCLPLRRLHRCGELPARPQINHAGDDLPGLRAEPWHQSLRHGPAFETLSRADRNVPNQCQRQICRCHLQISLQPASRQTNAA